MEISRPNLQCEIGHFAILDLGNKKLAVCFSVFKKMDLQRWEDGAVDIHVAMVDLTAKVKEIETTVLAGVNRGDERDRPLYFVEEGKVGVFVPRVDWLQTSDGLEELGARTFVFDCKQRLFQQSEEAYRPDQVFKPHWVLPASATGYTLKEGEGGKLVLEEGGEV